MLASGVAHLWGTCGVLVAHFCVHQNCDEILNVEKFCCVIRKWYRIVMKFSKYESLTPAQTLFAGLCTRALTCDKNIQLPKSVI